MRTRERAREGDLIARKTAGPAPAEAGGDAEIIARVRAGDTEAYAELMRAHAPFAHRTAVLLGAGADAEDVVQDAFVKAYLALGGFREGAAFRPWLLRIVANETRNTLRSAQRMRTAVGREAALGGAEPAIPESADPAVAALAGERRSRLLAALDELSEPQRRVVTYRYLLDLDEAETAQALGWPRGTVKSRLSRALKRLELLLGTGLAAEGSAAEEGRRGSAGESDGENHRGCSPARGRAAARRVAGARARAGVSPAGRVAGGRRDIGRAGDGADTARFGVRSHERSRDQSRDRAGPGRAGPRRAGPGRAGPGRAGPGRAGPGLGGGAVAGPARPDSRAGLRGRPQAGQPQGGRPQGGRRQAVGRPGAG